MPAALALGLLGLDGAPAWADEMIYGLAPDAVCRDATGKIIEPRLPVSITAATPAPYERGPYDLVKLKEKINGEDCYFHRVEAILESTPSSCTVASSNGSSKSVAGVRGGPNCSAK